MSANWPTIALRDLCSIARGGSPRPIKNFITDDPNGINWIKIGDTQKGGRYIDNTAEKIKPEGISRSRFVEAGSFLLSNSMSFGRPYILRTSGCIHDGWLVLEPDYERVNQDFLYHVLGARTVFDQFDRLAAGSTVRNLNIALVEGVEIPLPPLEEQQRIVAVLDEAFEGLARARAHAEANLQNAWELFDGATAKAFSSDEYLSGEETSLAKIVSFHNGDRGKNYPNKHEYVQSGIPWINTGHIEPDGSLNQSRMNFITEEKFEQLGGGKIQPGDLVFCLRGATIGKTAFVDPFKVGAIASSLMIIRPSRAIDGRFLYYYLTGERGKTEIERFIGGAAQPNLAGGSVGQFKIILPSIEVQEVIASNLNRVRNYCKELSELYSTKLQDIDNLRQSLMQKAFAGELT